MSHMTTIRESLYPFEIALQRSPDERPEFRRVARTVDCARLALDHDYEQLRELGMSGDLLLIDHDHRHVILERRPLPNSSEHRVGPGLGDKAGEIRDQARQRAQLTM